MSDDAFMAALSGAGEILHDGFDTELLGALLKLAEDGRGEYGDDLMQRLGVEALARALGASHAESMRVRVSIYPLRRFEPRRIKVDRGNSASIAVAYGREQQEASVRP